MAKDAIEAVKAAEEEARTLLQEATINSRDSLKKSEQLGDEEYNRIILQAETDAKLIRNKAILEGETIAKPILERGTNEAKSLSEMNVEKLESAVNIIIERIVNANGNS
jgi:V/A-type H+-transporting ATPase subunit G/H